MIIYDLLVTVLKRCLLVQYVTCLVDPFSFCVAVSCSERWLSVTFVNNPFATTYDFDVYEKNEVWQRWRG